MKTITFFLILVSIVSSESMQGQKPIQLKNPDFEADEPAAGFVPAGWINLGAHDQTPPDIQPGFFGVMDVAQHGYQYLGLCVRQSNSWEGVGQVLSENLVKGSSYTFSVWMSRSNSYQSPVVGNMSTKVNFNAPTILKIWGYNTKTQQEELLAESQPVGHSRWVRYDFVLNPLEGDYDEIDLMAYYAPNFELQNGNLLIDNCSSIVKIEK